MALYFYPDEIKVSLAPTTILVTFLRPWIRCIRKDVVGKGCRTAGAAAAYNLDVYFYIVIGKFCLGMSR